MDMEYLAAAADEDATEVAIRTEAEAALHDEARARFELVYREHRNTVLGLLRRRLGDDPEIPDLMQEAYLRILRYRDCGPESLKLLLFRVALNLATSHGTGARRRLTHLPLDGLMIAMDAPSIEESAEGEQRMQQLFAAVGGLPDRCRQVFLLRLLHGLRQREIAERCGISTRRVEQHLHRAHALIRAELAA